MANRGAGNSVTGEIQPASACCTPLPTKNTNEAPIASRLKTQVRTWRRAERISATVTAQTAAQVEIRTITYCVLVVCGTR